MYKLPLNIKILSLLLLIFLVSCDDKPKSSNQVTTTIGGKIINPKMDYVLLMNGECILDTLKLDSNNNFKYSSTKLKGGLYTFRHFEYQIMYVEPGDSIMLRVNTVDFDESLTYTGKGGKKNNLLIDLYLKNEKESRLMSDMSLLSPSVFLKKVDSLMAQRIFLYNDFKAAHNVSDDFSEIARASIDYDYFTMKELYLSAYYAREKFSEPEEFPDEFYDFRKKIDYNNKNLQGHYAYFIFLNRHFDNLAHLKNKGKYWFNRDSYVHNNNKMTAIDSLVNDNHLKNYLLKTTARRYLLNGKNAEKEQEFTARFLSLNTDDKHQEEISILSKSAMNLVPGKKIPNLLLINTDEETKELLDIIKNKTVFYFWMTQYNNHYKDIHLRVNKLQEKFPQYTFIGLNLDDDTKKWKKAIAKNGYSPSHEFQIKDVKSAELKLVINSISKAIVVDGASTILENNGYIFHDDIETTLLGYLKR